MGKGQMEAFSDGVPAFVNQWISDVLYVLMVVMWLVPDRRIERVLSE